MLRVLLLVAAVASSVHGLSCKMCVTVVEAVEAARDPSTVCGPACAGNTGFPQCTDLCSYLLTNTTFIKTQVMSTNAPCTRLLFVCLCFVSQLGG